MKKESDYLKFEKKNIVCTVVFTFKSTIVSASHQTLTRYQINACFCLSIYQNSQQFYQHCVKL